MDEAWRLLVPEPIRKERERCESYDANRSMPKGQSYSCWSIGWCPKCTDARRTRLGNKGLGDRVDWIHEHDVEHLARIRFPLYGDQGADVSTFSKDGPLPWEDLVPKGKHAARHALAVALGYDWSIGYSRSKMAWKQLGAIVRTDPLGGPRDGWPRFSPVIDMFLPLVKTLESGETQGIEPEHLTQEEQALYHAFYSDYREDVTLEKGRHFEEQPPRPIIQVTPTPEKEDLLDQIARPPFDLRNATLNDLETLAYKDETIDQGTRTRIVDAKASLNELYCLSAWWNGRDLVTYFGTLSPTEF